MTTASDRASEAEAVFGRHIAPSTIFTAETWTCRAGMTLSVADATVDGGD